MSEHEELIEELNDIKRSIAEIKIMLQSPNKTKQFLKIKDIATLYGTSYSHLCNNPILLPRCGESDYSPRMWQIEEVNEWLKKPRNEKEEIYRKWQANKYKNMEEKVNGTNKK